MPAAAMEQSRGSADPRDVVRRSAEEYREAPTSSEEEYTTDSTEDSSEDRAITDHKAPRGLKPCFNAKCFCHVCYVIQFLIYLIAFPLWAKWLVTSPKPDKYWYEEYPLFPRLPDVFQNRVAELGDPGRLGHEILLSPLPSGDASCNFSCGDGVGPPSPDSDMNFMVHLALNDSYLPKVRANTIYPVLLASVDFEEWWVVADRRHAHPHGFWASRSFSEGQVFSQTTDECTMPPAEGTSYTAGATYVLACITWKQDGLEELMALFKEMEDDPNAAIGTAELAAKCDAIGGVCGWPCGSNLDSASLPGCSADGVIHATRNSVMGQEIPGANFEGRVVMQACEEGTVAPDGTCVTSMQPMRKWPCHHCRVLPDEDEDEDEEGDEEEEEEGDDERRRLGSSGVSGASGLWSLGAPAAPLMPTLAPLPLAPGQPGKRPSRPGKGAGEAGEGDGEGEEAKEDKAEEDPEGGYIYTSLPRFTVKLHGVQVQESYQTLSMPRAFILRATSDGPASPPAAWRKLYGSYAKSRPPTPVAPGAEAEPVVLDEDALPPPVVREETKHAMRLEQENRLEMKPDWCFGPRGPMYIVACAVNQSIYSQDSTFTDFEAGQKVAPPPFNDRCLAIGGRCALACMGDRDQGPELPYCEADGTIDMRRLMGHIEVERNRSVPVWLFVYTLLIGFAVKVVMLCPGVFKPYPFKHGYEPELTEQLRYIATCTCSAGENKCTVLRNLIGVISCMPRDCRCRYHVVFADEGHRADQKAVWQRLCGLLAAIPDFGDSTYEDNMMQFMQMWTEETKKLDLHKLDDSGIEQSIMDRVSGKSVVRKLRREVGWFSSKEDEAAFAAMENAVKELEASLQETRSVKLNQHRDDCLDWAPRQQANLPLRLHYLARAKPIEDERTVPAQHVAPGTWYYKMPPDARLEDWLNLRAQATEYIYGIDGPDDVDFNVPLRTSRGKAGGLNFCENYLTVYAEKEEHLYGDERDDAPCLFSICDARHQFQPDFFHTTLPYFFHEGGALNTDVAFTQCPQYFHEMQDKLDYLDNNNAAFFRLNCMIRNCCGGVSSCGTNGTWMIKHRDNSTVWEVEKKRVRDADRKRRPHVIERRVFHESCKVEDTASSLQAVLLGRRSQFINRRLSYGMAKDPENYLAAVQRWAEGGVVLSLQTFLGCHRGVYMVWMTFGFFLFFVHSLVRLVSSDDWAVVQLGFLEQESVDEFTEPAISAMLAFCMEHASEYWRLRPEAVKDYVVMTFQFATWLSGLLLTMCLVWAGTFAAKTFRRKCCLFPDEMRWWARLLISMDNITYFFWFWTSFFWVGFNYYSVFARKNYHFRAEGMFMFMLVVNALHWGMTISSALRYQLQESMESNEVIFLTLDNVWRSTQLFYITAPLLAYSIIEGVRDYMRYQFYGEDISFWVGGDRGKMSKELVKYWTLLLIVGAVVAWVFFFAFGGREQQGAISACLIVTIIALDVLHPCTYLWVGQEKLTREEAAQMSWLEALTSRRWWARRVYAIVLNPVMTGLLRWCNPAWQISMPIICLWLPYIGVNQAFMTLGTNTLR